MKKLSILALCLSVALGIYSCGNESKTESQAGVYSMEKQVGSDGKTETVNQSSDGGSLSPT